MTPTLWSYTVPLAHGGELHWYDYLLYLVPLLILATTFAVERWRTRSTRKIKRQRRDSSKTRR